MVSSRRSWRSQHFDILIWVWTLFIYYINRTQGTEKEKNRLKLNTEQAEKHTRSKQQLHRRDECKTRLVARERMKLFNSELSNVKPSEKADQYRTITNV